MDIYEIRNALTSGKTIYDLPLRVTYYARVSTDKDEQLHSLSAQVSYYTDFIQRCPNWTFVEGYVDEGLSGTSVKKRERFLRMIEDAHEKKFDFIVTKEISRFSRNTLDSIRYTQELLQCGVGVFFQSDNINTLMPDAELRLTIMSSIAQDEVRKISERVKFGFKRAIENGVVLGSNRIWGYRKQDGKLVIDETEAEIVRLTFDLYANQYMGVRAIANYLTDHGYKNSNGRGFSFSTVRGILSNPKYKGWYCGGKTSKIDYKLKNVKYFSPDEWIMYRDEENVPPIVTEELWDKANRLLMRRSEKQSAKDKSCYQNQYPYSGKIICGIHKTPYYRSLYRYKSGNKEVWQCQEYVKNGKSGCEMPILYTSEIDDILRQSLEEVAKYKSEIVEELIRIYNSVDTKDKIEAETTKCKAEMDTILQRKNRLLDLSISGNLSNAEFAARNERFNAELKTLEDRLAELEKQRQDDENRVQYIRALKQMISRELDFSEGFTVGLVDALLDHMEVMGTEDKKVVHVTVYLKGMPEQQNYVIKRSKGKTSVCTRAYT